MPGMPPPVPGAPQGFPPTTPGMTAPTAHDKHVLEASPDAEENSPDGMDKKF